MDCRAVARRATRVAPQGSAPGASGQNHAALRAAKAARRLLYPGQEESMAKQKRKLKSISAADLERVRGGVGSITITASAPQAAGGSPVVMESMSFNYSRIQF